MRYALCTLLIDLGDLMRTMVLLCLLLAPALASADDEKTVAEQIEAIVGQAEQQRDEALLKADWEFRTAVAKTFKLADRVDVFLLDFSMGSDPAFEPKEGDEVFEIRPDNEKSKVIKSVKVSDKDIPKWRDAAAKMCSSNRNGGIAGCHLPIHGLRLYAGEKLLFETSFCWECHNYQFTYGFLGPSRWVPLNEDADDLKKLLHDLMPIPESEKQRFSGPKTKLKGGIF